MDELRTGRLPKVADYTRVSTPDQNPELQLQELRDYADRHRWEVVECCHDVISGTKARRPALDRLMADTLLRKFDCVLVWKLDRFGRSLVDCLMQHPGIEELWSPVHRRDPGARHRPSQPNLVNFDFRDGTFIVSKVLESGYLAIGKQKMRFVRED